MVSIEQCYTGGDRSRVQVDVDMGRGKSGEQHLKDGNITAVILKGLQFIPMSVIYLHACDRVKI